ncbi:ABC transporter ATP-binding protein [Leptospira licerasiae]|uniref:ABC transporter, ATP-binding protein n=1 Tax=Leptospira licerasiae str. MMD4847 TaxID=1049971 RepID=A0ABP2R875_9LEPT|nr:ABC transporter ATP-binding protein [Leptospira licerasiae]EIE01939.1 ABC transporter, ATP-binding protein [Leptospira licerasiae serovar Varillal str. VAR 010]EJZ40530.1 ABC transporter, ATP-binding protein [Leptospira licerasiae str. MMD4847]TGM90230.1 ABC transporter ATP-binding protein [Leptospira licerasiae]
MKKSGKNDSKDPVFETEKLSKIYDMGQVKVPALNDINVRFFRSEFSVLLGPSGSGKSTLLNILGGLDSPSSGKILFNNKPLQADQNDDLTEFRRKYVGFVFQFYNLIPSLSAEENVRLVTDISDNPMSPSEALELVGLTDRKDHFPSQLSGGEQQRVAIARAIVKRPEILLCDEPTGALDFKTGKIVLDAIAKINKELGTTTIIITHNVSIASIADRVVEMRDGSIVSDKPNLHKSTTESLHW